MTAAEADVEKAHGEVTTPSTTETSTTTDTEQKQEEPGFELIRTQISAHTGSRASSGRRPFMAPALCHTGFYPDLHAHGRGCRPDIPRYSRPPCRPPREEDGHPGAQRARISASARH